MSNFYFTCYIIYFFIAIFSFLYSFLLFLSAFFPWFLPICAPYSYAKAFSPMISISQRYSHMGKTFCNVTSWEDHWCNMHADVPATPECGGDGGGWDGGWGGWGWAAFCSVYDLQKPVLNVCRVCSLFTLNNNLSRRDVTVLLLVLYTDIMAQSGKFCLDLKLSGLDRICLILRKPNDEIDVLIANVLYSVHCSEPMFSVKTWMS